MLKITPKSLGRVVIALVALCILLVLGLHLIQHHDPKTVLDTTGLTCWIPGCGSSSEPPEVVLVWNTKNHQYVMDEYAMREQPPSQEELASTTKFFLEHPTSTINDEGLWGYALELIYSGNAASAKQYLNIVWPAIKNVPADDTMYDYSNLDLASFEKGVTFNLQRSPYYEALLNLNGGNIF
jgi:hypothetical protein